MIVFSTYGFLSFFFLSFLSPPQPTLDSVIRLICPQNEAGFNAEVRTYSLENLRELQNKLMLIANKEGNSHQDVNYFIEV